MGLQADLKLVEQDEQGIDLAFRADVLRGLAEPQKAIPARWLYDLAGSELFERITNLPEYYPTRVETRLLETHGPEIAGLAGADIALVEFGSGSSVKTPILLCKLDAAAYVPIDISGDFLRRSTGVLAAGFPDLAILPIEADFLRPVRLPDLPKNASVLGFFPGSTIGNLVPESAVDLLRSMRETLGPGSRLLVGVDCLKPIERLLAAYDDAGGVTAAFNLNLLHRINEELDGDIPLDGFRHRAIWNDDLSRIEMHLESIRDVSFTVSGQPFAFAAGSTIHTENSHKYGYRDSRILLRAAGWGVVREWTDDQEYFSILLAEAEPPRFAP